MATSDIEFPREISAKTPLDAHLRTIEEHLTKNSQYTRIYSLVHPLVDHKMTFSALVGTAQPGVAAIPATRNQAEVPGVPATEATSASLKQQSELLTYLLKYVNLLPPPYLHRANPFDGGQNRLVAMAHAMDREGIRNLIREIHDTLNPPQLRRAALATKVHAFMYTDGDDIEQFAMKLGEIIVSIHDCYSTVAETQTVYTQLLEQCKITAFKESKSFAIHSFLQTANSKMSLVEYIKELHNVHLAIKDTGIIRKRTLQVANSFATNVVPAANDIHHKCDWCKVNRTYLKYATTHTQDKCFYDPKSPMYDVTKTQALKEKGATIEKAKENWKKRPKSGRENLKA